VKQRLDKTCNVYSESEQLIGALKDSFKCQKIPACSMYVQCVENQLQRFYCKETVRKENLQEFLECFSLYYYCGFKLENLILLMKEAAGLE